MPRDVSALRSRSHVDTPAVGLGRALLALAALGVLLAGLVGTVTLRSDHLAGEQTTLAVLEPSIGLVYIASGLVAWARRPANRFGALMVAVGFTWLLSRLDAANAPVLFTAGLVFDVLFAAVALHMLLAFPSGRLEGAARRVVVAVAYVTALALGGGRFLVGRPPGCSDCPEGLLPVGSHPSLFAVLTWMEQVLGLALLVAAGLLLALRLARSGPFQRRSLELVVGAGLVVICVASAGLAAEVAEALSGPRRTVEVIGLMAFGVVPLAFLGGLLRGRLAHAGAIGLLVERLAVGPVGDAELRDALAAALGDPSLTLAYWVPDLGRYVDADGVLIDLTASGRAVSEVEREGRPVGALIHDRALAEQPGLVRAAGSAAALALDNGRLTAELRASLGELRASRSRIVAAGDEARGRLERDLHDGAQQRLVALLLNTRLARRALGGDGGAVGSLLDAVEREIHGALAELRELARGLLPPVLAQQGLEAALDELAGRLPLPVGVRCQLPGRLPAMLEVTAYFVAAEALANVGRHAEARRASVRAVVSDGVLTLEVRDDGRGGASAEGGSGLRGLDDRVGAADGRLVVQSERGRGTRVRAELPIPGAPGPNVACAS